eukprot:11468443-Karenia_brevis.AAC.1
MRTVLAVQHHGTGVTGVTIWSDSKIVVDGFKKGKATLQSGLCTDWEDMGQNRCTSRQEYPGRD